MPFNYEYDAPYVLPVCLLPRNKQLPSNRQRAKLYLNRCLWICPQKVCRSLIQIQHNKDSIELFSSALQEKLLEDGLWAELDLFQKATFVCYGVLWGLWISHFDCKYWEQRLADHNYLQNLQMVVKPVTI